jgi:hypothetical protein
MKKSKKKKRKKRKQRRGTRKFHKENCAPRENGRMLKYTCYTNKTLLELKDLWNARHRDNPIQTNKPREIWKIMKQNFRSMCNVESCWLRQNFVKHNLSRDILNQSFRPLAPDKWKKNPQTWLNSLDIANVMKQYEAEYPCFAFIGPSPIDYDTHEYKGVCVWEELCKFNLYKHKNKGIRKIGVIFNLDPHTKGGSHWVCAFIHIPRQEIYYMDSYCEPMPKQIKKFTKMVQDQAAERGETFNLIENSVRHQYTNSECGMYCLYMIISVLKGRLFKNLMKKRIPDARMLRLRKKYFNHKKD